MTIPGDTRLSALFWILAVASFIALILTVRDLIREAKQQLKDIKDEQAQPNIDQLHSQRVIRTRGGGVSL